MKVILGKKIGMGTVVDENGDSVATTFVQADDCYVTRIKTVDSDGYNAYVLGHQIDKPANKSVIGQSKEIEQTPAKLQEFRFDGEPELKVGDKLACDSFAVGESVYSQATGKGKGYSGTIKKWNFSRGPESHGSKNVRLPGSIGSMYPQKVFKGKKMSGQHGRSTTTTKNQTLTYVDAAKQIVGVKGSLPGSNGQIVSIKESK